MKTDNCGGFRARHLYLYWAFQHIEALAASKITTGFPDGTFRPTELVTRAQMATFLVRALGLHWAP